MTYATRRYLGSVTLRTQLRHISSRHDSTPTLTGTSTLHCARTPSASDSPKSPFYFETGYALFAKRPSKPFPPSFLSPTPSSPSTNRSSRGRQPSYNGQSLRGLTNGDDAILVEPNFIGANDGVGAWATREKGHAALWSRLILHFWALEASRALASSTSTANDDNGGLDPIHYLQVAFEATKAATIDPDEWHGTTTTSIALLHHTSEAGSAPTPLLLATNLGDSEIMVIRPSVADPTAEPTLIHSTSPQWHWFDCPRQLGTNSPDTPVKNACLERILLHENDIVLAITDGLTDNLWGHEIVSCVGQSLAALKGEKEDRTNGRRVMDGKGGGMTFVAEELVRRAREVAGDPFAESPFMERAVEEGIGFEGGT